MKTTNIEGGMRNDQEEDISIMQLALETGQLCRCFQRCRTRANTNND